MASHSILLDVGGVLLVPHADAVAAALGTPVTLEEAQYAHYAGVRALDAATGDQRDAWHGYLQAYAEAVGATSHEAIEQIAALFRGSNLHLWAQPVGGSIEGLQRLGAAGHRLGIVSNSDGTVEEQLKRHQICQIGEGLGVPVLAIIDSHVVGVSKPEAEIFRHAVEALGASPEECVYVGDTVRYDVAGARAAEIKPVHFDPYELCPARQDHAHVRRLGDLLSS